jgi:hypothetical protein
MILKVITSKSCGHCKNYVRLAERYVDVETADIMTDPSVRSVPYSRLYDENTLVAEWAGANIEPLFENLRGEYMRIRFKMDCYDKYTGQLYKKGAVKMMPEERAKELIEAGVASEVKTKNDKDKNKQ